MVTDVAAVYSPDTEKVQSGAVPTHLSGWQYTADARLQKESK